MGMVHDEVCACMGVFFSLSTIKDNKSQALRMCLCSLERVGLGKEEWLHC